ncbi:hypothetical protein BJ912DRAFT_1148476 [Pholiota molesta]|nr:hypothetical protein BJ912DRAFT_1148476 [Pholiota molesta]
MGFVALIPVGTPCIPVSTEKFPATLDALGSAILQDGADTYAVAKVRFSFDFVIFTVSIRTVACPVLIAAMIYEVLGIAALPTVKRMTLGPVTVGTMRVGTLLLLFIRARHVHRDGQHGMPSNVVRAPQNYRYRIMHPKLHDYKYWINNY